MADKYAASNGSDDLSAERTGDRLVCPCCSSGLALRKANGSWSLRSKQPAAPCRPRRARCSSTRMRI